MPLSRNHLNYALDRGPWATSISPVWYRSPIEIRFRFGFSHQNRTRRVLICFFIFSYNFHSSYNMLYLSHSISLQFGPSFWIVPSSEPRCFNIIKNIEDISWVLLLNKFLFTFLPPPPSFRRSIITATAVPCVFHCKHPLCPGFFTAAWTVFPLVYRGQLTRTRSANNVCSVLRPSLLCVVFNAICVALRIVRRSSNRTHVNGCQTKFSKSNRPFQ